MIEERRAGFIRLTPTNTLHCSRPIAGAIRPEMIGGVLPHDAGGSTIVLAGGRTIDVVENVEEVLALLDRPRRNGDLRLDAETTETLADFKDGPVTCNPRHLRDRVRFLERAGLIERAGMSRTDRGHAQLYRITPTGVEQLQRSTGAPVEVGAAA